MRKCYFIWEKNCINKIQAHANSTLSLALVLQDVLAYLSFGSMCGNEIQTRQ